MKRRLLTLLLTLVFCVTSVAPGFAMNADDLGGAVPAASAVTQMSATDKISAMEKMLYGTERQFAGNFFSYKKFPNPQGNFALWIFPSKGA